MSLDMNMGMNMNMGVDMNMGTDMNMDMNIDKNIKNGLLEYHAISNDSLKQLLDQVLAGGEVSKEQAIQLIHADLEPLCKAADEIRKRFCGAVFDICTIINGKSGRCSENCKYCAQAACYKTNAKEYPLLPIDEMVEQARYNHDRGMLRFSIVTSGRRLSEKEVDQVCEIVKRIKQEVGIEVCVSAGLLDQRCFQKLHDAGVTRVHNNLESSEHYFPSVCSTHTYEDKKNAIRAARAAGMNICSGGIIGLGESWEDRIDLALTLRELGVKSIPVNVLSPILGTPYEHNVVLSEAEVLRTLAIFRFLNPDASIRMAGGRIELPDKGRKCFESGANAAISGDMLTTSGNTIAKDLAMLHSLGYEMGLYTR